ncbi:hypothetical protein [Streptomyces sp. NPDC057854]|uniref:hypothetical protein n=1 Tax=unclassified Streptomyces TaxID=2593676 RepID=UPI003681F22D
MAAEFVYGQSRTVGGYTWYCQRPGAVWKTDPCIGYELERRSGDGPTGWYLYGGSFFGEYLCGQFTEALSEAAKLIERGYGW